MEPIWARPEQAARGPRPAHSRAAVAAAAVRIADTEGIDAVSMRRVAADLGAGTASLYRYLASKDDLLDLMVDAVAREQPPPDPTGDRRADLRTLADTTRAVMLRHPWLAAVQASRPNIGPGSLRWLESWLTAVDGLGLDADEMLTAVDTVRLFITGAVLGELAVRASGLDMNRWMAEQGSYGDAIAAGDRYPRVAHVMREAKGPHAGDRAERTFAQGIERILDGVVAG
ncbi:TetR/AcrR family transcriptional regulator [Planotetraspora kaengkrachanensis]|uniref:TetR family transcriptional regulator n=1 Tax=Planotetraspora kaengkrachanensis TaxID=575193 RepID=A0A8J3PRU0_9ACTN|nr:TetR/AcrR family transcriptional regulator [Planotetraspora kaengkrachanensis]GIG78754.1 TetR family transcriptional regulator [Planotetraspora kaengkrachanensis]